MANLLNDTLAIALERQGRLLQLLHQVTKLDLTIYERFGETPETLNTLSQLQNARERLTDFYSRLSNLLWRVCEAQPSAASDLLNCLDQSLEEALATADAIEASLRETKQDWNI
ncbi:hypothetical protein H6G20_19140 [Desertifilum sp. FACHB-1129]|uniref:Uncharacterized protein n=2 Tax=Desertifilum tharense IPPAS B-1220 TaxID=1781255 RepID=A0A1E5QL82_9CYAN|nr:MULTISPECIES: hypothetical protein [Desertifilum]MCD8489689.1 hypothetical protein [Desertifilum sp.]MDA0209945.1 hypothetical protein [Cyanobacteria bacterium FC1]NES93755.1 hypothetical protein [Desertifilum sp. SIO1I2]MBD2313787.1 hypothetical protein [Desertifilum sp. FACHB-1129]MBD2324502.1 hypothetical protein [Desertifilum sp. FACHB-866]